MEKVHGQSNVSLHLHFQETKLGERKTLDPKVVGSILTRSQCCVLEQDTLTPLLITG